MDDLDLYILADQWMQAPGESSAGIAPIDGGMTVNLMDFAELANNWMY